MSRMIDADALIEKCGEWYTEEGTEEGFIGTVKSLVDRQPTIEERKKGKWIEQDDGWDGVYYECSCCKEAFTLIDGTPSENLYNYCPNCGADMRW